MNTIRRFAKLHNEENKRLAYEYHETIDWNNLNKELIEEICVLLARQEYDRTYKRERARENPVKIVRKTKTKFEKVEPETKELIINCYNEGMSMSEISRDLDMTLYMIKKIIESAN